MYILVPSEIQHVKGKGDANVYIKLVDCNEWLLYKMYSMV